MAKKRNPFVKTKVADEEALKNAIYSEIMMEIRKDGKVRDEVRRALDNLPPWTEFTDVTDCLSSPMLRQMQIEDPAVIQRVQSLIHRADGTRTYENSRYMVHMTPVPQGAFRLSIRTTQRDARHDWREFQRIKNELCGPEYEAIELYPAESRLVDTSNQFYLFVLPLGEQLPLGFEDRLVMKPGGGILGSNQRAWEPGTEPSDVQEIKDGLEQHLYRAAEQAVQGEKRGEDSES